MKITDVKAHRVSLEIKEVVPTIKWRERNSIIVEVETDEGFKGVGEAFGSLSMEAVKRIVEDGLRGLVLGEDPSEIQGLTERMLRASTYRGRTGVTRHAIAGLEIALWDLLGKSQGLPVYRLLGGAFRDRVKAYTSMPRIGEPEGVEGYIEESLRSGFRYFKLHEVEGEAVAAARRAAGGDTEIMVDVNCPWRRREAASKAAEWEEYNLTWLEEPLRSPDDYEGLAWLRTRTETPIAAGENESTLRGFKTMMDLGAVDVLQPSLTKIGGLHMGKKVCALAEAYNVEVAPHSWTLPIGVAASLHLAISTPPCTYVEVPPPLEESPLKTPLRMEDGHLLTPEGAGLGLDLDEEILSGHTVEG